VHLDRIDRSGAYPSLLKTPASFDSRERRHLTDLVSGVTRRRRWLDFVISHFVDRPLQRLDPPLLQVLRLGLYEMAERSRPPHAIVNEYVSLTGRTVRKQAGGFVNAVLRRIAERIGDLPEPSGPDLADNLGIRFSHPTWMVRRWLDRFGESETRSLLGWNNQSPVFAARVNSLLSDGLPVIDGIMASSADASRSSLLDDFVRLTSVQPLVEGGMLADGRVQIQDESAGLVVRVLDARPGETVVDACAAPGGKLLYCCARMNNRGRLVAIDANAARLRLAERAARQAGCSIAEFVHSDATSLPPHVSSIRADRVLVDAPCSGLGVLGKRADLRWRRSPADISDLTRLQDRILDSAATLVRPGGLLVYSTCTIEPEENEQRVAAFLARHKEFSPETAATLVPGEMLTAEGYFASLPQRDSIDGAFAARLRLSA
jgi:16S rRNA (cytosine967-C5)-methyltransferase